MIKDIHRTQGELAKRHDEMAALLNRHSDQLDRHTVQIDALFEMGQQHTRDIAWLKEHVFTKEAQKRMFDTLDFLVYRMQKMSDDHDAAIEWLKRHELRLDRLEAHTGLA